MIVWAARKPFIDKNRAAMVDFMEDSLRIVRWYLDPENHKAAMEIAGRVTKQPAERSTGCSPSTTPTTIPTCCPIWPRCSGTST